MRDGLFVRRTARGFIDDMTTRKLIARGHVPDSRRHQLDAWCCELTRTYNDHRTGALVHVAALLA